MTLTIPRGAFSPKKINVKTTLIVFILFFSILLLNTLRQPGLCSHTFSQSYCYILEVDKTNSYMVGIIEETWIVFILCFLILLLNP